MPERIISFQECLRTAGRNKKHALLGNGFSMALFPQIFGYGSLAERANFEEGSSVKRLFDALGTSDFEAVLDHLDAAARVGTAYNIDQAQITAYETDAALVRDRLVQAIAGSHPALPAEITEDQYRSCRAFLRNFDRIYTLNYDLLLYWALMHDIEGEQRLPADDGFRSSPDDFEADYVTWESHHSATVHFLHGALHLFDSGPTLRKYTWVRTGTRLMEQVRAALDLRYFPLFVAEGSSARKVERIIHHGYLHRGFRSFEEITGALFVYGHSLADNDNHFFDLLRRRNNKVILLFVSLHGDQNTPSNQAIIRKARAIEESRQHARKPLQVFFYNAASARVWN